MKFITVAFFFSFLYRAGLSQISLSRLSYCKYLKVIISPKTVRIFAKYAKLENKQYITHQVLI